MIADQRYLFGMGNLAGEEGGVDSAITCQLIHNLGAKSVRVWLHFPWVMTDPFRIDREKAKYFHTLIKRHQEDGMQVVVMNHHNYYFDGEKYLDKNGVLPSLNTEDYQRFLSDYQASWRTLVKEFPEVEYWEIHNEANGNGYLKAKEGDNVYTLTGKEKARAFSDMLYYGSKGIHEANPNAYTVMGGLARGGNEDTTLINDFLHFMYDYVQSENSPSKNADEYFQIACWHPYMYTFDVDGFEEFNDGIYQVIKMREGKDKKVFFTEMGWSSVNSAETLIPSYMEQMFARIKEKMYYVETVHYFRMYDRISSCWGAKMEKSFGLFEDPTDYVNKNAKNQEDSYAHETLGKPKKIAYTFQTLAGGKGSLTLLENKK